MLIAKINHPFLCAACSRLNSYLESIPKWGQLERLVALFNPIELDIPPSSSTINEANSVPIDGLIGIVAFVESTVNEVISKRLVKKQQMRWTKRGAH